MFFVIFWTALVRYTWLSISSRFFFRQSVLSDVFGLMAPAVWAQRCGVGGCRREATWIICIFLDIDTTRQTFFWGVLVLNSPQKQNNVNVNCDLLVTAVKNTNIIGTENDWDNYGMYPPRKYQRLWSYNFASHGPSKMQVSARQYVHWLKTHRLGPSDLGEMVEKQLTHLNQPLGENINWSVLFANGFFG